MTDSYEHFLIKSYNSTFNMSIKETPIQYVIYLGGKKKGCVELFIDKPPSDPRYSLFFDATIAKLTRVEYDSHCSLEGLVSGEGTRNMLRTTFDVLRNDNRFQHVKTVDLDDASYVTCPDGGSLSLAHLSIATNGATWYEKHFQAVLKNPVLHNDYMKAKKIFQTKLSDLPPYEIIFRDNPLLHTQEFIQVYKRSQNLNDFFTTIRKKDKEQFCKIMNTWLETFVNKLLNNIGNQTWRIDLENPIFKRNLTISVQPLNNAPEYMTGGGPFIQHKPRKPTHTFDDL